MEKNYSTDASIRGTMKDMNVEDIIHFPLTKLSVVRTTAANLGIELSRKYMTRLNRKAMTVDVTRLC